MRSSARTLCLAFALAACSGAHEGRGESFGRASDVYGQYEETGLASWYGEELLGNRTATGERFDPAAITAAHRSLPLGSFVEVTDVETGRSILVRINDRGPGRKDRLIDLSRGAARLLGTDRRPIARVRIRSVIPSTRDADMLRAGRAIAAREPAVTRVASVYAPPPHAALPAFGGGRVYVLQVATFSNETRARALARVLAADVSGAGGLWRVRIGPFDDAEALQRARDAVAARGYGDAQILSEDRVSPRPSRPRPTENP